jgi:GTP diphosphokinase / guanosine-3',5'-bis(diphosphate) 3'-diphosphatase
MRTLDSFPQRNSSKWPHETLYLFAPWRTGLGFHAIKSELEDLAMKYTEPEAFQRHFAKDWLIPEEERNRFISSFIQPIRKGIAKGEHELSDTGPHQINQFHMGKMEKKGISL